jgi:hypothetical protein
MRHLEVNRLGHTLPGAMSAAECEAAENREKADVRGSDSAHISVETETTSSVSLIEIKNR